MAAQIFSRIGQIGAGLALAGTAQPEAPDRPTPLPLAALPTPTDGDTLTPGGKAVVDAMVIEGCVKRDYGGQVRFY